MTKRMLIDAMHAEETRVVVLNGTRLEEFDVETSTKKQLKGNIYLAKIVRVEPSLQAAFVEYGGNRHGFLAFNEIHPDYYQIPVADRQALLAEQREVMRQSAVGTGADFGDGETGESAPATVFEQPDSPVSGDGAEDAPDPQQEIETLPGDATPVDSIGGDEVIVEHRHKSLRHYKIQEVIKRRQIVLVQVVKEERGNKGAALTTYLSLAGRYCVLMPNTARGGGVSRKITNAADRKRLKSLVNELDIPDGMAVIVRTAGAQRTKPEIKRDYEYLLRLWTSVRDLTLQSTAPALVYEEANLIKRSIRDLYTRDIDEILVEGEEPYRLAKDFMRMLTPSHAKRVQLYKDQTLPLLHKYQVEAQLDSMHSPVVQLKSGGYLVINQTEALVAIDVNSGRATRERHIEETALKTNLEASDEIARQLRLRDLAGLIVIDFIDMEESRNNHAVERRLKDALRLDRARIQLGRISGFGLLEMSRQRLRPSLMETSFLPCAHCNGTGLVRSVESAALHLLRVIEEEGLRHRSTEITMTMHPSVALYILNQKRARLIEIEARYGLKALLTGDESLVPPAYRMERVKAETAVETPVPTVIHAESRYVDEVDAEEESVEDETDNETEAQATEQPGGQENGENGRRRRRRRRRGGRRDDQPIQAEASPVVVDEPDDEPEGAETDEDATSATVPVAEGEPAARRRRRGKRGGRRRNRNRDMLATPDAAEETDADADAIDAAEGEVDVIEGEMDVDSPEAADTSMLTAEPVEAGADTTAPETPPVTSEPPFEMNVAMPAGSVATDPVDAVIETAVEIPSEPSPEPAPISAEEAPAKPKRTRAPRKKKAETAPAEPAADTPPAEEAPAKPKRPRAPRKKKVAAAPAEPTAETVAEAPVEQPTAATPIGTVEPIPAPDVVPEAASAEPPVDEAPSPEIEAAPTAEAETAPAEEQPAAPDEPTSPPRRGWWNRHA